MNEPGNPSDLAEGTLISHLLELRDRLLKAMLAVGICFVPCAYFMNQIFSFVAEPLIPMAGNKALRATCTSAKAS